MTKHVRWRSFDKSFTMKSWQNIYEEIMTKHIRSLRWRNHDKTYTMKFRQIIYDEIMTKHKRWNHDKTFTFKRTFRRISSYDCFPLKTEGRSHDKTYTMKSWQNIYDEIMTKHLRKHLFPVLLSKCHVVTLFQRSSLTWWHGDIVTPSVLQK